MGEVEKKMQKETFDVEVQYCDPSISFVFKEIFKAGPSVFFLSVSSMVIAGTFLQ